MKTSLKLDIVSPTPKGYDRGVWQDLFEEWTKQLQPDFDGIIQVSFVSRARMSDFYNQAYGEDHPTDVLSLRHQPVPGGDQIAGEIVICPSVAREAATRLKTDLHTELATLFVHGLLHLSGLEHDRLADRDRFHHLTRDIMASHSLEAVSLWSV